MRISDWSSDVCSSDLVDHLDRFTLDVGRTLERTADTRHHDLIVGVRRIRNGVALRRSAATLIGRLRKCAVACDQRQRRSEEHTSELQSLMRISYAVFCLKKKKKITKQQHRLQRM